MNAPLRSVPATTFLTPEALASYRDLAAWHEDQGRDGSAVAIRNLVFEIENLREAAEGSRIIVNQAVADKNLARLWACTLLIVAEKIEPVIDKLTERARALDRNYENWPELQALSDELRATIKSVKS